MTLGLDIRTAKVEHYRQVYDLLGGDFFYNSSNPKLVRRTKTAEHLGDKLYYDNTNTVDWLGGYVQANYDDGAEQTLLQCLVLQLLATLHKIISRLIT